MTIYAVFSRLDDRGRWRRTCVRARFTPRPDADLRERIELARVAAMTRATELADLGRW